MTACAHMDLGGERCVCVCVCVRACMQMGVSTYKLVCCQIRVANCTNTTCRGGAQVPCVLKCVFVCAD